MIALRIGILATFLVIPTLTTSSWVGSAEDRLRAIEAEGQEQAQGAEVAVAAAADEGYCTPSLKRILRRVLQSCGLLNSGSVRGCQPLEAKNVATMSGGDFNALFKPMKDRGGIIQFEQGKAELDDDDRQLIDRVFADQRGASYFFVVSRSSPEGAVGFNRDLSKQRAEAVMNHLRNTFDDPDLDKEVGLLWLGEEFAQLDPAFCEWRRSAGGASCEARDINRSAFIAWIDCRL